MRTEQATDDSTGAQGFAAVRNGDVRTWKYSYNAAGQLLTVKGPLADLLPDLTNVYDDKGNLSSTTNALGHKTTYFDYDANGNVGSITLPNGTLQSLSYSPRGRVINSTVRSGEFVESTSYEYDGVGQITKVIRPDGAFTKYDYDQAHRLVAVTDSHGNSIRFTLDVRGNRLLEQVNDPNGALARQVTREFDSLNRLVKSTGALL